jgi:thiol:disulfide interchange protein DsbC
LPGRVKEIPLEKGIKIGDGKSVVIEFTDPDCTFCRKAADWLEKNREGVTRYVFLYPITRLLRRGRQSEIYSRGQGPRRRHYLKS